MPAKRAAIHRTTCGNCCGSGVEVAKWNAHPLGWPCPPFKDAQRAAKYVRELLIYNGFRPSVRVTITSPRQIQAGV